MTIFPFSMIPFGHFQASSSRRRPASSDATTAGYVLEHQCVGHLKRKGSKLGTTPLQLPIDPCAASGSFIRSEIPCQTGTACGSCSTARVSLSIATVSHGHGQECSRAQVDDLQEQLRDAERRRWRCCGTIPHGVDFHQVIFHVLRPGGYKKLNKVCRWNWGHMKRPRLLRVPRSATSVSMAPAHGTWWTVHRTVAVLPAAPLRTSWPRLSWVALVTPTWGGAGCLAETGHWNG